MTTTTTQQTSAVPLPAITAPLLHWFADRARELPWRETPTPYQVWISEIMLQQTRVAAVLPYFTRFIAALPDTASLAAADENLLLKLWVGVGYYSRARNLQKTARILMTDYAGQLPADYEKLLTLPGIGRYTAGAISSIAYGRRHPAVDGNVLRVIMRLTSDPADITKDATKRRIEKDLLAIMPAAQAGAFNQALMELGALVCLPRGKSRCEECPLAALCQARAAGTAKNFPIKPAAKKRRCEQRTILLLCRGNQIAIDQRPPRGLLAGLWELPGYAGRLTRDEVRSLLIGAGFKPASLTRLPPARHIFSHIEWDLIGWRVELAGTIQESAAPYEQNSQLPPLHWVDRDEISHTYSIPAAFHYYLPSDS